MSLNLSHKFGEGHGVGDRVVPVGVGKRVNMPATGIVSAKDALVIANQGKGGCPRLLVVKSVNKAAGGNIETEIDRSRGQAANGWNATHR